MSGESPWSMANVTPRGGRRRSRSRVSMAGSVGKRTGTPAAEYLRWTEAPGSPISGGMHGLELGPGSRSAEGEDEELDFEINETLSDQEGFEGLENVRACCDGKHDVGHLSSRHHHHHHHHQHPSQYQGTVRSTSAIPPERPGSPSGWSFHSSRRV